MGLVLGDATPRTIAAKLFHDTGGDVRLLLARLLVMVQEALPADLVLHTHNGAGPDPANPVLRLAGDHWTLTFAGQTVHLRDTRGCFLPRWSIVPPRRCTPSTWCAGEVARCTATRIPTAPGRPSPSASGSR